MDRVIIFDTTLRDGEQAPGFSMNTAEKLEMARQLARLNVDVIEAGFPISSDEDFEATREVARQVGTLEGAPIICGLSRVGLMDIDRCWEAVKYARRRRIHTFVATSDIHLKYKLRKSRAEILKASVEAVTHARGYCEDVEFSPEDASRSDFDYMCDVLEAVIDAGAGTINIPDTVGLRHPRTSGWSASPASASGCGTASRAVISVHCHNDLGQAVANSVAAVMVGRAADRVHGQRHRGARGQRLARRDRHGAAHPPGLLRRGDPGADGGDLPHLAAPLPHHRRARPAQQGHRRRERLRPRGGHPPGRRAQGEADLRDHAAPGHRPGHRTSS